MDLESLQQRAKNRRASDVEIAEGSKAEWKCEYCGKAFVRETAFMNHNCKERERAMELASITGQRAYVHYSEWMRQKKRSVPKIETFATSRYYSRFIKFAKWATQVQLPSIANYIKVMIHHGFDDPFYWTDPERYALYLEWFDSSVSPEDAFVNSVNFVSDYQRDNQVQGNVFKHMGIQQMAKLIKSRKLSMWYVLSSPMCKEYIMDAKSDPDFDKFLSVYDVNAWVIRMKQNSAMVKDFTELCKEMNL